MTQRNLERESHAARLDRLERQTRTARVGWLVLAVCLLGAMRVGATSKPSIPNLLVAQKFRLVDEQGVLRGLFATDREGRVVLSAVSVNGKTGAQLALSDSEPYLTVRDPSGAVISTTVSHEIAPAPAAEAPPCAREAAKADAQNDGDGNKSAEKDTSFDWLD